MAGIQLGGLVSGFDTTSMVESLMKVEQLKVDKVQQQKMKVEWQKEAYVKVSDRYSEFILSMRDTFGISNSISSHGLTRPSTTNNLNWLNKATTSNSSILEAKVLSEAKPGKYEVKVTQLAETFKAASAENVSKNKEGKNLAEQLGLDAEQDIDLEISNGKESIKIEGKAKDLTMDDLVTKINSLSGVSASYDKTIDRFFIQTTETGAEHQLKITDNTGTGTSTSGGEVLKALKLDSSINSGQTYTGQNAKIDYNGAKDIEFSSNTFNLQGIEFSLNSSNVNETVIVNVSTDVGQNAKIDYNGAKDIEFSSNTFNLQGIEFSLNSSNVNETVIVNVSTDVDAVVDKVKTFVDEYNKLTTDIGKILGEATYRDYAPLTDAQKENMTEKQIELWEEKAKSGLLRNDSIISMIQQNIKSAILQDVVLSDGTSINLNSIGIQTKSYSSAATSGELQIDEEKLRAAITNNPSGVIELFFATPSDSDLNTSDRNLSTSQVQEKRKQCGLFNRITDVMVNGMSQIINKAGAGDSANNYRKVNTFIMLDFTASGSKSLLDNRLLDINKRITTLNNSMAKIEARYWSKFTAMETALSKLQSQQSMFYNI